MSSPVFLNEFAAAFGQPAPTVTITGHGDLPSPFRVSDLAVESMAFASALLHTYRSGQVAAFDTLTVDRRLAAFWFDMTIRPLGWALPSLWDAVAGNYRTADDRWIRLHTNAPHHLNAALTVLGCGGDREQVSAAVKRWQADELERAVVEQGGCAAKMHSLAEWQQHPQGQAVSKEPLLHRQQTDQIEPVHNTASGSHPPAIHSQRPLQGIRVLDLTRVLAGPVAGRFLAAYGAEVLRIDPPWWEEPGTIPEVTLGKRCARLDLREADDLEQFKKLLAQCDVLLHGYRPGALASLGLGEVTRKRINPHRVDVALNAYGWTGPWRQRRGFDSLVQMSNGIAHQGMRLAGADKPVPLPVQALDHATGYLLAAAVIDGLRLRRDQGKITHSRLSLARTGECLISRGHHNQSDSLLAESHKDRTAQIEHTSWGQAQRVKFPVQLVDCPARWDYPASALGSAEAQWQ